MIEPNWILHVIVISHMDMVLELLELLEMLEVLDEWLVVGTVESIGHCI